MIICEKPVVICFRTIATDENSRMQRGGDEWGGGSGHPPLLYGEVRLQSKFILKDNYGWDSGKTSNPGDSSEMALGIRLSPHNTRW